MPEQLCLFDTPTMLDFLFFALLPSMDEASQIAVIREHLSHEHRLKGNAIQCDLLHVSLHGIGAYHGLHRAKVERAKQAAAKISMKPFEVVFNRAMSFDHKRRDNAFVLRTSNDVALMELYRALGEAMKSVGFRRVASRFTPHMTLLYGDRMVAERSIEAVRWTVRDFVLVQSLRGRGRSEYIHLARWPLRR